MNPLRLFRKPAPAPAPEPSAWERQRAIDAIEAQQYIGRPVIYVPNEWDNIVVGFCKHIDTEKGVVTFVQDYVEERDTFFLGFPYFYTRQRLDALLKLDPFERCSIIYRHHGGDKFDKVKTGNPLSREATYERLHDSGFFAKVKHHLHCNGN